MKIENPHKFFSDLGDLHDARIGEIRWSQSDGSIHIFVDDLQSNFTETTGYRGARPAELIFDDLRSFQFEVPSMSGHLSIYEILVEESDMLSVSIKIAPFGLISFQCSKISLIQ